MVALQIRYVDGSEILPRGRLVGVAEGEGEVVVAIDLSAPPEALLDALSTTITAWAKTRWLYIGQCQDGTPDLRRVS